MTAVIEAGAGLALLALPSPSVTLLLDSSLDTSTALTVGRVGGAGLFAPGVACWLARNDGQSRSATGLVAAMLLYNLAAVALWPEVILHAAMAAWCMAFGETDPETW